MLPLFNERFGFFGRSKPLPYRKIEQRCRARACSRRLLRRGNGGSDAWLRSGQSRTPVPTVTGDIRVVEDVAPYRKRHRFAPYEDAPNSCIILTAPSERGLPSQTGGGAFGRCKNRISNRRTHSPSVTLTRATSLLEGGIICRDFVHYSLFIIHYSLLTTRRGFSF